MTKCVPRINAYSLDFEYVAGISMLKNSINVLNVNTVFIGLA